MPEDNHDLAPHVRHTLEQMRLECKAILAAMHLILARMIELDNFCAAIEAEHSAANHLTPEEGEK